MTTLTIQVGQCGNQLGSALFESLHQNLPTDSKREVFFDARNNARAVLIDMEPKVVDRCLSQAASGWSFNRHSAFTLQSGAGNNWAYGYSHFGPTTRSEISGKIRKQLEISDRTEAVLILKSTAGGTGSGVGAYIQEMLSSENFQILTTELWPFVQGEVCVQTYNTALSLAASQEFSDLVVSFENSAMEQLARNSVNSMNSKGGVNAKPDFPEINKIVADHLAHQLIPSHQGGSTGSLVSHLACLPEYKIATARFLPQSGASANFSTDEWKGLFNGLASMLSSGRVIDFDRRATSFVTNKTLTANFAIRGSNQNLAELKATLKAKDLFCPLAIDPIRVVSDKITAFHGHPKSCSSLSIDQHPVAMLETMLAKGAVMLKNNAYVHLYENHGIAKDQLADSLLAMHETVLRYKALSSSSSSSS